MVTLIKEAYVPKDYEILLHKKRQSLRQKEMDVSSYIEEFHKLTMKSKLVEPECVKLARYMQGLRMNIQDKLNLCSPNTVQKCFQFALREEKDRRYDSQQIGKGNRGFIGKDNFGRGKISSRQKEAQSTTTMEVI